MAHAKREPSSLNDRSSRPHFSSLGLQKVGLELVPSMRRCRMTGERTATSLRIPRAEVARILKAAGIGKLKDLEPRPVDAVEVGWFGSAISM